MEEVQKKEKEEEVGIENGSPPQTWPLLTDGEKRATEEREKKEEKKGQSLSSLRAPPPPPPPQPLTQPAHPPPPPLSPGLRESERTLGRPRSFSSPRSVCGRAAHCWRRDKGRARWEETGGPHLSDEKTTKVKSSRWKKTKKQKQKNPNKQASKQTMRRWRCRDGGAGGGDKSGPFPSYWCGSARTADPTLTPPPPYLPSTISNFL